MKSRHVFGRIQSRSFPGLFLALGLVSAGLLAGCNPDPVAQPSVSETTNSEPAGAQFVRDKKVSGLTIEDIPKVERLMKNEDKFARVKALTAIIFAKPEAVPKSLEIARVALDDSEGLVRLYALSAINRLDPAEAKLVAVRFKEDSYLHVREKATKILSTP